MAEVLIEDGQRLVASLAGHRRPPARDGEAPSEAMIEAIVEAAVAVPDHGYVRPFRFVVVTGDGRSRLAEALAADMAAASGQAPDAAFERACNKAYAAPCLLAVIASPDHRATIPLWEQLATASCCGYAAVLAAQGLGLGSIWKSPNVRDGAGFVEFFGLSGDEQLLGWVLLGTLDEVDRPSRRVAPDPSAFTTTVSK